MKKNILRLLNFGNTHYIDNKGIRDDLMSNFYATKGALKNKG
jgi:hypothetical protein